MTIRRRPGRSQVSLFLYLPGLMGLDIDCRVAAVVRPRLATLFAFKPRRFRDLRTGFGIAGMRQGLFNGFSRTLGWAVLSEFCRHRHFLLTYAWRDRFGLVVGGRIPNSSDRPSSSSPALDVSAGDGPMVTQA